MKYMIDTEAYQELTSGRCPLADNYEAVRSLLQELVKRKAINRDEHKMMLPKFDTLELAHLYFIPKVHKVRLRKETQRVGDILCFLVAKYTTATNHCFHPCTSNRNIPVSRQASGAHILESCSKNDLHQWI